MFLLTRVSYLPCCPSQCVQVIAGAEWQPVIVGHGTDHWLRGWSIEVSCHDHWPALDHGSQPCQYVLTLLRPEGGQQSSLASLEMGGDHTQLLATVIVSQHSAHHHLVTLHSPHLQDPRLPSHQTELVSCKHFDCQQMHTFEK